MTATGDNSETTPPNPDAPTPPPEERRAAAAAPTGGVKVYDTTPEAAPAAEPAPDRPAPAAENASPTGEKRSHGLRNFAFLVIALAVLGTAALMALPYLGGSFKLPGLGGIHRDGGQQAEQTPPPAPAPGQIAPPARPGTAAPGEVAALQQQVAALQQQVAELRQRGPVAEGGQGGDLARIDDVAQRVSALEQSLGDQNRADPRVVAALTEQTQRQGEQIAQLQQALEAQSRNSADAASVLRLSQRLDAAEEALRENQSRRESAQALLLAVGQLREAVNQGGPFQGELETVKVLAGDESKPLAEAVGGYAQQGIPNRLTLRDRFNRIAPDIVRADLHAKGGGWFNETLDRLSALVTVRRIDGEAAGKSTSAIVARAEQRLADNDLSGAMEELTGLEGEALDAATPWMSDARARLAAERSLSELTSQVVARTANMRG